ncbi:kinase-like domain-containing protein [Pilobolus umbonatus]|nr:kinase-like domain-containing protein [Pilobolus umbonatus]
MLYKKKAITKHESSVQAPGRLHIGVIETTMMYQSGELPKEHFISVFTLLIEEPDRHLVLIRYYQDFIEFDRRIKCYSRKCKVSLPKLQQDGANPYSMSEYFTHNKQNLRKKILYSFTKTEGSNADKLENYLQQCVVDLTISTCSLFQEFLQPQREEDNIISKSVIQSYVQQQQQSLHGDNNMTVISTESAVPIHNPSSLIPSINSVISNKSTSLKCHTPSEHTERIEDSIVAVEKRVSVQDFQLIKVIGRGCMGKVLLVRHHTSSKLLALKAISKKAVIEQKQIIHIKAEQQILSEIASIHHPFLIKLHFSFQDLNQLFLVLDYHVGGDLATQLRINHTLPPERCRFYTAEIILGIQELHRLGILYRDLKPENILLTADGHIVLTDFGLSKQFYDNLSVEEQRTDTFCGTAEYLAPEILNYQPYSYEVDYWSMGTILYEMLTGITPFWSENRDEMYKRIREDPLQFPEFIDIETADFVARLLKRDPRRRLGSGLNGPAQVRSNPYFVSINWDHIYHKKIKPPYIPNLYSETDFSHFDSEFLRLTPRLSPVGSDYVTTQSLDRAFDGYSYINRDDRLLDSPPSEVYSLSEPPTPITLMDTNRMRNDQSNDTVGPGQMRYYIYHDSDEVIPYDEYAESSTGSDIIHGSDLIRQQYYHGDDSGEEINNEEEYYRHIPPRTTNRLYSEDSRSVTSFSF